MSQPFADLRILVLEDEYLIAMDVEAVCRDHGAREVLICRSFADLEVGDADGAYDAAILDLMIGGSSTVPFARQLVERGVPFVFASGYGEHEELSAEFPDIPVVAKPYSEADLVAAIVRVIAP